MTDVKDSGVELPDADLWRKFDVPVPRYTSYPTADRFRPDEPRRLRKCIGGKTGRSISFGLYPYSVLCQRVFLLRV